MDRKPASVYGFDPCRVKQTDSVYRYESKNDIWNIKITTGYGLSGYIFRRNVSWNYRCVCQFGYQLGVIVFDAKVPAYIREAARNLVKIWEADKQ